ncbi:MAG: PEGA domain-containing protein [Planctomycetota bacterium]
MKTRQKRFFAFAYVFVGALFVIGLTLQLTGQISLPRLIPTGSTPEGPPELAIRTTPTEVVAAVMVDGRFVGSTTGRDEPLVLRDLEPGEHIVKIESEQYESFIQRIELRPGRQVLEVSLQPVAQATLLVTSTPTHADVTIDGVPRGKTPLEISGLTPGTHTVRLDKTEYVQQQHAVVLKPDATETLDVELKSSIVAFYESEIRKHPRRLELHVDLAHHYLVNKDFENLAIWLGAAMALRDEGPEDPSYVGRLNAEIKKIERSEGTYENFTDEERDALEASLGKARIYALKKNPDNPAYKAWLLMEAQNKGDLEKAQQILEDGLVNHRADRTWFLTRYGYKNWRATIKTLDAELKKHPDDFVSLYQKAALYLYAAEVAKAIEVYRKLVELPQGDPVKVMNLTKLGELYERAGKPAEAIGVYAEAIELSQDPLEKAQLAFSIGVIHQDGGDMDKAIPYYYRAIGYQPNIETACRWRIELAKLQMSRDQSDKASQLLGDVLKLSKNERTLHRAQRMQDSIKN